MCVSYAITSKKLAAIDDVKPFIEENPLDEWLYTYYSDIRGLDANLHKGFFAKNPGIALGFIRKAAEDSFRALDACEKYFEYLVDVSQIFVNNECFDLFTYISELHLSSVNIRGADTAIDTAMQRLIKQIDSLPGIEKDKYKLRLDAYTNNLNAKRSTQTITDAPETVGLKQNLADSIHVILDYYDCPVEVSSKFIRNVIDYTELKDRSESDDNVRRLRRELSEAFYDIYQNVLIQSLDDPKPPTIINMFLNFGYVDATLCGHENADYLYSIADTLKGDPEKSVYTLKEWMIAIYTGKKEPSKSELDEDYSDKINELKTSRKINEQEAKAMLADRAGKMRFELENVFPVTHKVTSGTVSTFCPTLSSHTIMRTLEDVMATPDKVINALDEIRAIDFSAYYREIRYEIPDMAGSVERLNLEVLPDIILLPNVGTRGILWQEIMGRDRTTAARMFIPIFLQTELYALMVRLTGDFRWEMCKRVQGTRWSDITNPSLTSEICDYLQFYMTNRDLPDEARTIIRNELSSARNNFKTVFTSYYSVWVQFESKGLARFNKILRRIMITYCPFTKDIRFTVKNNPQFTDIVTRYNNKQQQRIKALTNLIQKIQRSNKKVPQEIYDEIEFAKK